MRNPFNFEVEPFEFDTEFDGYKPEQSDIYSEFGEEYESDFEGEPFEIYREFDEAYEMETDPPPVGIGQGRIICGVVYRDFKIWYDQLAELWQLLREEGMKLGGDKKIKEVRAIIAERDKKIKKARNAHFVAVQTIVLRLKNGWYASKGCKEVDFNFIISKTLMTDKELKEDKGVQQISKWLSGHAEEALKKAQKASQKSMPAGGRR